MVLDLLALTNSFNICCVVRSHYINSDHDVMFFSKCMFNLNFKAVYAKQQTHWIVGCAYIWPFHSWEFSILPEIFSDLKLLSYANEDYRCTANSVTSLQHALIFSSFEYRILSISSISSQAIRRLLCIVKVKFSQRNSEDVLGRAWADKNHQWW